MMVLSANIAAIFLVVISLPTKGSAQTCLTGLTHLDGPSKHSSLLQMQMVIPGYTFSCNTTVTQWEAQLHSRGRIQQVHRIDFQVWRPDTRQRKYFLAGSNSFSSDTRHQQDVTLTVQSDKLVVKVDNPTHYISVCPGDIVGIFFQGEGIELRYRSSSVARTYKANQVLERYRLSANLAQEPALRRVINGSPLIKVHTDDNVVMVKAVTSLHPSSPTIATTPALDLLISSTSHQPTSHESTAQLSSMTTSSRGKTKPISPGEGFPGDGFREGFEDSAASRQQYLIGGFMGGGLLVFIITCCVALGVVLLQRRKQRNDATISPDSSNQSSPDLLLSSSESALLSHPHLGTKGKKNRFAFDITKRQVTAPQQKASAKQEQTNHAKRPEMEPPSKGTTTQNHIAVKENLCYSALSGAQSVTPAGHEHDLPLGNEYDLPFANEYETPIESSIMLENIYDTVADGGGEEQIYEEI